MLDTHIIIAVKNPQDCKKMWQDRSIKIPPEHHSAYRAALCRQGGDETFGEVDS